MSCSIDPHCVAFAKSINPWPVISSNGGNFHTSQRDCSVARSTCSSPPAAPPATRLDQRRVLASIKGACMKHLLSIFFRAAVLRCVRRRLTAASVAGIFRCYSTTEKRERQLQVKVAE
eukprot:TRINITY_DN9196_c1_g1_i1.p1 TRINITY_DN9196_c1_g1~~TRINITY_DN9196_c1_g1_i1.p1  ORF type:complete len:118 (+),score=12.46 TRINITY_DN9196_c1_g1_i1:355-708(+)